MDSTKNKWPKTFPPLTQYQQEISNDFMRHWHEVLSSRKSFSLIENFNHQYVLKNAPFGFVSTLEIGAGLGEHLNYETLNANQRKNYVAVELRETMAQQIRQNHPDVQVCVGDCQQRLEYPDNYFDRIIAIHVLEHLPNLPAAVKEMHRLCNKEHGFFSVVIPCEGGKAYSLARKISAQRIFEKRYQQPYKWFIEREHINLPEEIRVELQRYFTITSTSYFPLAVPSVNLNLCIGMTLVPRQG